ncbi:MAG: secondary thiamine-phosphate synthase enzyme YjbQ [Phycisphaeraceae bacterium]
MQELVIKTQQRDQMVEITAHIQRILDQTSIDDGSVIVFVPHTTAGVTINENADPDVVHDTLARLDKMVPWRESFDRHGEGNSASHVKASMMGSSVTVLVQRGKMMLGRWQGVWFCEFDGPRTRSVWVTVGK